MFSLSYFFMYHNQEQKIYYKKIPHGTNTYEIFIVSLCQFIQERILPGGLFIPFLLRSYEPEEQMSEIRTVRRYPSVRNALS